MCIGRVSPPHKQQPHSLNLQTSVSPNYRHAHSASRATQSSANTLLGCWYSARWFHRSVFRSACTRGSRLSGSLSRGSRCRATVHASIKNACCLLALSSLFSGPGRSCACKITSTIKVPPESRCERVSRGVRADSDAFPARVVHVPPRHLHHESETEAGAGARGRACMRAGAPGCCGVGVEGEG